MKKAIKISMRSIAAYAKKRRIHILCLVVIALVTADLQAQNAMFGINAEKTVAGLAIGSSLSWKFKNQLAIGAFAQAGYQAKEEIAIENPLYGLMVSVPLVKSSPLVFAVNLRSGIMNKKFLVIIPALETTIDLGERTGFVLGTSIRMRHIGAYAGLNIKL